ncbi:MAG: MATE family efflux transporter [Blautia sp.]|nr:MATE family efflux transporter [Blautia sp.]
MNKNKFDWKTFLTGLIAIGLPVAFQNVLTTTGSMVDTIMLATQGELAVGAVGLCAQFTSLLFSGYWGFVGGGMLFFSQYWGAKDGDGVCKSYGLTMLCMMTVGFTFGLAAIFAPEWIMRLYTDKKDIQEIGVQYLRIVGFSYPLQTFSMAMSAMLRSTERVKIPLVGSIMSLVVNMCCNYILIFGKFGFPQMGVRGAALATVIAGIVNAGVIFLIGGLTGHPYLWKIRKHYTFSRAFAGTYFKKCFPIICNEVLIGISNMVVNVVLGHQMQEAIIATAVFRTLEGFLIAFFAGFTNAATVLVGKCVGAGEHETGFQRGKRLVWLCPLTIFTCCMAIFAVHKPVLTAMGLTGESYQIGSSMLLIYAVMGSIRMTNWMNNDTFRSAGDPSFGTILEIAFSYVMMLPCIILSGTVFHLPFLFVFFCAYIDEPIRVIIMLRHMFSGKWIKPVTVEGRATLQAFREAHGITSKDIC